MRLADWQKTDTVFDRIWDITKASFSGIELPPQSILHYEFGRGQVFVNDPVIDCYSILSEKFGEPYIWAIATDPAERGRGLAGKVLDEIEDYVRELKNATGIGLTTNTNNPAQKLYFDKGYRVLKHLPGYYGPGESGLFMRRPL
jgi:ribosomal protein S18 acetylase RimI-like enzyme